MVGGNFQITNNAALDNMNSLGGFTPLTSIGGNLWISGNPDLSSLTGLDNIDAGSIDTLYIFYNDTLTTCNVTSICDYLEPPGGYNEIHDNAPGCDDSLQIMNICNVFIEEMFLEGSLSIFPNPCSGAVRLRYSNSDPSTTLRTGLRTLNFELYSIDGVLLRTLFDNMQHPGEYELEFDVSDLPGGMYFIRMQSGDSQTTVKLVVMH